MIIDYDCIIFHSYIVTLPFMYWSPRLSLNICYQCAEGTIGAEADKNLNFCLASWKNSYMLISMHNCSAGPGNYDYELISNSIDFIIFPVIHCHFTLPSYVAILDVFNARSNTTIKFEFVKWSDNSAPSTCMAQGCEIRCTRCCHCCSTSWRQQIVSIKWRKIECSTISRWCCIVDKFHCSSTPSTPSTTARAASPN